MVYVLLANGFEEVEALAPVDVLRRAGIEVKTVAVEDVNDYLITGSHGITVKVDLLVEDIPKENIDAIILPGGMPGTANLEANKYVIDTIHYCHENGKLIAAICAAPSILGHLGLLSGKKATCFPGYEKDLHCAVFTGGSVVTDGNIITADGVGNAIRFGQAIAAYFVGGEAARRVTESMQCRF